jgi:hypothetical protein
MSASVVGSGAGGARARRAPRWASVSLLASFFLSGCYSASPIPPSGPAPGTRIHAELTREGAAQMAPQIGSGVLSVEGFATRVGQTEWDISLVTARMVGGSDVEWNREVVRFPVTALGTVTERKLQKQRSYVAAGLVAGAMLLAGRLFGDELFTGGRDDGGGTGPVQ